MSDIVSARRLRKSMLKNIDSNSLNIDNNIGLDFKKSIGKISMDSNLSGFTSASMLENSKDKEKFISFKTIFLIKCFVSLLIVFGCLVCKLAFKNEALSNNYIKIIVAEYNKDYSKEQVLESIEDYSLKGYNSTKYIFPESLVNKIKNKYIVCIKPKILEFNLKEEVKSVLNNNINMNQTQNVMNNIDNSKDVKTDNISNEEDVEEKLDGKGGGEPLTAEGTIMQEASAVSMMQDDIGKIIEKKINMIKPLSGTITSSYGARDKIFEGVNSYHTGLDIAAKSGTEIKSSTSGKVTKLVKNDKYYGNYVVVESNGVNFKYAHMKEIKVDLNSNINQNDLIGLVGSTGMSTGPHLHFEISINTRTVDPQILIQF